MVMSRTKYPGQWLHLVVMVRTRYPVQWLHLVAMYRTKSPIRWVPPVGMSRTKHPGQWLHRLVAMSRTKCPGQWLPFEVWSNNKHVYDPRFQGKETVHLLLGEEIAPHQECVGLHEASLRPRQRDVQGNCLLRNGGFSTSNIRLGYPHEYTLSQIFF